MPKKTESIPPGYGRLTSAPNTNEKLQEYFQEHWKLLLERQHEKTAVRLMACGFAEFVDMGHYPPDTMMKWAADLMRKIGNSAEFAGRLQNAKRGRPSEHTEQVEWLREVLCWKGAGLSLDDAKQCVSDRAGVSFDTVDGWYKNTTLRAEAQKLLSLELDWQRDSDGE